MVEQITEEITDALRGGGLVGVSSGESFFCNALGLLSAFPLFKILSSLESFDGFTVRGTPLNLDVGN